MKITSISAAPEKAVSLSNPHAGQPIFASGEGLEHARAAFLLVHGRGASAYDILGLAAELEMPGFAYLAPQAAGNTWYPNRFFVQTASNQPWLDSALAAVERTLERITTSGIPPDQVILMGFSQGACLALEYAARNARRYAGVVGLSGGLIGADGEARNDRGNLMGTPVFLGCSDIDPHIPLERVYHTERVLQALGGSVETRIFPGMGHSVNPDELSAVKRIMTNLIEG